MDDKTKKYPKRPVELRVAYRKLDTFLSDYRKKISKGWTFIETDHNHIYLGTKFILRLSLPGIPIPMKIRGEVTLLQKYNPPGIGIRLSHVNERSRMMLESLVEKLNIPRNSLSKKLFALKRRRR
ncbi:MAG: TIGR02266 family protein [Deltaproteobacteria bacterium]|nr:MAG: TIGR02266 family protein [Deltaproteobacteria bacterium]